MINFYIINFVPELSDPIEFQKVAIKSDNSKYHSLFYYCNDLSVICNFEKQLIRNNTKISLLETIYG